MKLVFQQKLFLEPEGKNTAPAVALAAAYQNKKDKDSILLVLAADHVIQNQTAFEQGIHQAIELANDNKLVTFGIVPTHAETGYGYIEKGAEVLSGYSVKNSLKNQV